MATHMGRFDGRFFGPAVHVRSSDDLATLLGPDSGQRTLAQSGVFAHELRHYYDYLLSPMSSQITTERLDSVLHIADFVRLARASSPGTNALPVPLPKWCKTDKATRRSIVGSANALRRRLGRPDLSLPDLPVFHQRASFDVAAQALHGRQMQAGAQSGRENEMHRILARLCASYERIERLVRYAPPPEGDPWLQPFHVYEASALITQMTEHLIVGGDEALDRFMRSLEGGGHDFTVGLRVLMSVLRERFRQVDLRCASMVCTWAMLGDPRGDGDRESLPYRFHQVVKEILDNGLPPKPDVQATFAYWDERLDHPSAFEAVSFSLEHEARWHDKLMRNAVLSDGLSEKVGRGMTLERALDLGRKYLQQRRIVVEAFLRDPDSYIDPIEYSRMVHDLPRPPVRVTADHSIFDVAGDTDDFWVHQMAAGNGIRSVVSLAWHEGPVAGLTAKEACWLYDELSLAEVLFSPFDIDFHQADLREAQSLAGLDLFRVF